LYLCPASDSLWALSVRWLAAFLDNLIALIRKMLMLEAAISRSPMLLVTRPSTVPGLLPGIGSPYLVRYLTGQRRPWATPE
jgi:hypothetical protein